MPSIARTRRPAPQRSWIRRILGWLLRAALAFILASLLMVLIYRFVPPPITITQPGDLAEGHSLHKEWMPLSRMDRNMARAAIAAEDGNFCGHHGFDFKAIEKAFKGNAAGRTFRGGS